MSENYEKIKQALCKEFGVATDDVVSEKSLVDVFQLNDFDCLGATLVIEEQLCEILGAQDYHITDDDLDKIIKVRDLENYVDRVAPSASL